eukprot:5364608-Pyramimonas_sp.AAC.1
MDILSTPAFHVLIYPVSGLRPREFTWANAPRQPGMLDRKARSHLGFLFDMSLGPDATDLVCNALWAAM